ncbi:MAG: hypothetical protein ACI4NE_08205 [Succinivibrio sp.]
MSDYNYLKNSRNFKAFFKGASSDELTEIIEKLKSLCIEVKAKESEILRQKIEKEQAIAEMLDKLDNLSLTVEDLNALRALRNKKPRAKMKPKYAYVATDGTLCYWSGQGKIPKGMMEVMQRDGITDKKAFLMEDFQE